MHVLICTRVVQIGVARDNYHDLRKVALVLNAGSPQDFLAREHSNLLLSPQKEKPAFVQVDDVELVEVIPGRLVDLVADEVDSAQLLSMGKGRFDATSHLCRPLFVEPPPHGLRTVIQPDLFQLIGHLPERK